MSKIIDLLTAHQHKYFNRYKGVEVMDQHSTPKHPEHEASASEEKKKKEAEEKEKKEKDAEEEAEEKQKPHPGSTGGQMPGGGSGGYQPGSR